MKRQVKEWLDYASVDLLTAKEILGNAELSRSTAFHCHQAVEKALKAMMEYTDARVPRIHDLPRLTAMLAEQGIVLPMDPKDITKLDAVYVSARYPTDQGLLPEGSPALGTVREFYETAVRIVAEAHRIIKETSS